MKVKGYILALLYFLLFFFRKFFLNLLFMMPEMDPEGIKLNPIEMLREYISGAPGRIRTCGLRIRSPLLYPLSYRRTNEQ